MSEDTPSDSSALLRRVHGEMIDSFDEEIEMEIDDNRLTQLLTEISELPGQETIGRQAYFRELFRLQSELVKLQDWVVYMTLKL